LAFNEYSQLGCAVYKTFCAHNVSLSRAGINQFLSAVARELNANILDHWSDPPWQFILFFIIETTSRTSE
jgi:hypothetical protein